MSSQELGRIKQQYPRLAPLLDRLIAYIRAQTDDKQEYVIPKLAAAALRLNDGEAFVLLDLLVQAGVLRRVYNVYCRTENALLATVDSPDELDKIPPHCDFCDRDHELPDLKVEVAFTPTENALRDLAA